jgi:hypothetical protein
MVESKEIQTRREKVRYAICGTARIWGLLILIITLIVIISHIVAPDTQPGTYPPAENLIPALILVSVIGLGLAWKWKLTGALINLGFFVLSLLIYWIINRQFLPLPVILVLSPIYIPGILFLVCWQLTRISDGKKNNFDSQAE